jgi:hypothetical protein
MRAKETANGEKKAKTYSKEKTNHFKTDIMKSNFLSITINPIL